MFRFQVSDRCMIRTGFRVRVTVNDRVKFRVRFLLAIPWMDGGWTAFLKNNCGSIGGHKSRDKTCCLKIVIQHHEVIIKESKLSNYQFGNVHILCA